METIAFYSYKGGTGRSLLLANTASVLAWCGKTVVALDLDLEAPGLAAKFELDNSHESGIASYIVKSQWLHEKGETAADLEPPLIEIPCRSHDPDREGKLYLLPAGPGNLTAHADALAGIDWHYLLDDGRVDGRNQTVAERIFGAVKKFCEEQIGADYLLVDSRTGLTAAGAVALHVLSDQAVFLMVNNEENIIGLREMIRLYDYGKGEKRNLDNRRPYTVVVSRIESEKRAHDKHEDELIEKIIEKLNQAPTDEQGESPASTQEGILSREDLFVVHSDRHLELEELLLFDGERSPNDSLLFRDYHAIFDHLGLSEYLPQTLLDLIEIVLDKSSSQGDPRDRSLDRIARGQIFEFESDRDRATILHRIKNRTPPQLRYLAPEFHTGTVGELMKKVAVKVGRDLSTTIGSNAVELELETKEASGATLWSSLIAVRMLEGEYDLCGDLFYLTWLRSHLLELFQLGWLPEFSLVVAKDSSIQERLANAVGDLSKHVQSSPIPIRGVLKFLKGNGEPHQLAVLGETAAASECVRYTSEIIESEKLVTLGDREHLKTWLNENQEGIAACDAVISETLKGDKWSIVKVPFTHHIPVGIAYPKGEREWRKYISRAVLGVLDAQVPGEEKIDYSKVQEAAAKKGVRLFEKPELRWRALQDLPPAELRNRLAGIPGDSGNRA